MNGKSNSNGNQACASCKYQRRKCNSDCPLAPYFRPDQQKQFLNAHRLFGVSNILKILKNLDPTQRPEAMKTIIYQANMRSKDPVRGCYGVIEDLKKQIDWFKAELEVTMNHIHNVKQQLQMHNNAVDVGINGVNGNGLFNGQQFYGLPMNQSMQQQQMLGSYDMEMVPAVAVAAGGHMGFIGGSPPTWVQENPMHQGESSCSKPVTAAADAAIQDCDEFKHLIDIFDDRHSFINPKMPLECSGESSFKEDQQDNELKQAAQLFSLRNNAERDFPQHI